MTDIQPAPSNLPERYASNAIPGLDDFDPGTDMVMPRLTIVQKEALFKDGLTGQTYNPLTVVMLGPVKQRVLFSTDPDVSAPLCKSVDFKVGKPGGKDAEGEADGHLFPWRASGFDRSQFTVAGLPCDTCKLKEFGTHPTQQNSPWCTEQHVYILLMETEPGVFDMPALLSLQRSNIKASQSYMTSFFARREPMFVAETTMTLTKQKRGDVEYSTVALVRGKDTGQGLDAAGVKALHAEWADKYRMVRDQITTDYFAEAQAEAELAAAQARGEARPATSTPVSAPVANPPMPAASDEIDF